MNKSINPIFKFVIIKNIQLIKRLVNPKLTNEDISEILSSQSNPFYVFLQRNISSVNYINYENKNNSFCSEISEEIRPKIEDEFKNDKGDSLDKSWLNMIL